MGESEWRNKECQGLEERHLLFSLFCIQFEAVYIDYDFKQKRLKVNISELVSKEKAF